MHYTEGENPPDVSVIIVSYNTREILRECLTRVQQHRNETDLEVIVVDNASADGSADMVAADFPVVRLIRSGKNLGFAGGNNPGFKIAKGRYFLLLNSDAYLLPGTFGSTVHYMNEHPECGILGVRLVSPDGSMQPSARMLPSPWFKFLVMSGISSRFPGSRLLGGPDFPWWDHGETRAVGWVPGAFFLIRREVTEKIGYLDERYFMYFEEIDFCLQTQRSGWKVIFFPGASVIHLGGQSSSATKKRITAGGKQLIHLRIKSEFRYYRKNYGMGKVFLSAGVEIFLKCLTIMKNLFSSSEQAAIKREEAAFTLRLIGRTLKEDRFGNGTEP